jgi:hypothetical protein
MQRRTLSNASLSLNHVFPLPSAVQNAHNTDAIVDWLIEYDIVSNDKTSHTGPIGLNFAKKRVGAEHRASTVDSQKHSISGGSIMLGDVLPDFDEILVGRASTDDARHGYLTPASVGASSGFRQCGLDVPFLNFAAFDLVNRDLEFALKIVVQKPAELFAWKNDIDVVGLVVLQGDEAPGILPQRLSKVFGEL